MNSHRSRDHHIEVLVQISTKLIEDDFVTKLKAVESVEEVQELFLEANSDSFEAIMKCTLSRSALGRSLLIA